jgi:hypothetical protein
MISLNQRGLHGWDEFLRKVLNEMNFNPLKMDHGGEWNHNIDNVLERRKKKKK